MDSKKRLEQYIKPASWKTIVTWALLAIVVVSVAIGIGLTNVKDNTADAVQFNPYSGGTEKGEYAYIDAVLVSSWIYDIDNGQQVYYTVMDSDNNWYVVQLSKQQFSEMAVQYNYFDDENAPMPEPYRIYGLVETPDSDVRDAVASYWDLSRVEYSLYFGSTYLNAKSSPSSERSVIAFVVAMFAFFILIVFFAMTAGPANAAKKSINRLASIGELDNAAYELNDPTNESMNNDKVRFSRNYIFGKGVGAAVKYSDIIWCYKQTISNQGAVTTSLVAQTATSKKQTLFSIGGYDNSGYVQHAIEVIAERNPAVRLGYSADNIQASKNRFQQ